MNNDALTTAPAPEEQPTNGQPEIVSSVPAPVQPANNRLVAALGDNIPSVVRAIAGKLSPNMAVRLAGYLSPELLAVLRTAENEQEALDMLQAVGFSAESDANAPPILPVYTIQHSTQPGIPKKWVNPEGDTIGTTLYAVVLLWGPMRGAFLEGRKAPICSARGAGIGRGKAATDANDALKEWATKAGLILDQTQVIDWAGQEHDCSKCWLNEFGSDLKGRAGKACKEKDVVLFVLVKPDANGELTVTDEGYGFNVPTTSRRLWQTYIEKQLRQRKANGQKAPLSSIQVITALKLTTGESDVQSYGIVNPELARPLTPEEFRKVFPAQAGAKKVFESLGAEFGESYDDIDSVGDGHGSDDSDSPTYQRKDPGQNW